MIQIKDLTMTYPTGKGVFDINFEVKKGQTIGFLGPNGAGKTTTIRCLLGFMRGQKGVCYIDGRECFEHAAVNMRDVGFIAGEPAFPEAVTGIEYLNFLCDVRGIGDSTKMDELIKYFELDPTGKIKKMSKGMKQKVAIVAAFMHDPSVLVLDEPSSGLDPLMQNKFVELLLSEKAKGKTILMSSHMFEEVERTCEEVVIIKDGRIVVKDDVKTLKKGQRKNYIIETPNAKSIKLSFNTQKLSDNELEVSVPYDKINTFIKEIAKYPITNLTAREMTLENVFLNYYDQGIIEREFHNMLRQQQTSGHKTGIKAREATHHSCLFYNNKKEGIK